MRLAVLATLLAAVAAAVYVAQRERNQPAVDPAALMNVVGDVQRTVSRLPASAVRPTDADETAVGQMLATHRQASNDPSLNAYVERVGAGVARGARRRLPYSFHVIDSARMVNAFALPGGPVFIGSGLVALMRTEDELASVLAHEVEHIDHYHCIDRYQSERLAGSVPIVGALAQLPLAVFEAGYSKTQELEADAEGTRLAYEAGYSPLAAVTLLERMASSQESSAGAGRRTRRPTNPVDEVLRLPSGALDAYFRSHPPAAERVARIRDVVRDDRLDATRPTRPLEQTADRGVQGDVTSRRH